MRFFKKIALNFWHTKNLKIKLWVVGWKNWGNNCLSKCVKIILTRLHQKNVKKVKSWKFSAEWEWSTAEKYPIFSTFYISRTKGCQKKLISCHKVLKKCYNNTKISGQSENFSAVLHQGAINDNARTFESFWGQKFSGIFNFVQMLFLTLWKRSQSVATHSPVSDGSIL
mgnify:CR=1 FL=1